jgi:hypothetical protein
MLRHLKPRPERRAHEQRLLQSMLSDWFYNEVNFAKIDQIICSICAEFVLNLQFLFSFGMFRASEKVVISSGVLCD